MSSNDKKNRRSAAKATSTFRITESYKILRTNLQFAMSTHQQKVVLVSSAEPGVGKSTTTANLALTTAQKGEKVLLIEADMRKPKQHRLFHITNEKGLSDMLGGFAAFEEVAHKEIASHLDLITAGRIPPNPSELLGSQAMHDFLDWAMKEYDVIFIDTPPINIVADLSVLAAHTGGVLLVARYKSTSYLELEAARENIKKVGGTIFGVVINGVYEPNGMYGYNYKKYYSYNYKYAEK